jgi:hypothetical protein
VLVTADHGFLFQQKALNKSDKTELAIKPNGAVEAKKRYIVGENLPSNELYWKGKIADTAGALGDTEFMVPKGAQRFHFVGGAKFVHGGAMLQEICVPVLYIKELQKEQVAKHEQQRVGVVVVRQPIKLVNNIDKISFIQTDAVAEGFIARQLDVYIVDSDNLEECDTQTRYQHYAVTIDLAFQDDFF